MFRNLFLAVLAIGLIATVGFVGCGPRVQVAKDKVIAQIDEILGKLNVKLAKVEQAYESVSTATDGLREKRIDASVRLKKLQEEATDLEAEKTKLLDDLKDVKPLLKEASESSGKIERNGREISVDELKGFADGKVKRIKAINDQLNTRIKTLTDAYAKSLNAIKQNEETSVAQLAKLTDQIDEIKRKKSALDAMKEASSIVAPGVSLSDKFDELTSDVDDLLLDVDVQLETEMEKIDERAAKVNAPTESLDELLNNKTDTSSTMSDIDALLDGN